ncbi:MAG: GtrA family protein [Synergistaceae bacterium]|nr:GtrA family protein [Synergistaceae bacterium]MBR0204565.1 GtrA family protein [Synergistaceae bacterium]
MKLDTGTIKHLSLYGVFGVLTTILAIFLYWVFTRLAGFSVVVSSGLSWFLALLFAFFTNRRYVFHSSGNIFHEGYAFFMARVFTGLLDVFIMYLFVDVLKFYDMPVKIISNIIVIILNYIASKLYIFRR